MSKRTREAEGRVNDSNFLEESDSLPQSKGFSTRPSWSLLYLDVGQYKGRVLCACVCVDTLCILGLYLSDMKDHSLCIDALKASTVGCACALMGEHLKNSRCVSLTVPRPLVGLGSAYQPILPAGSLPHTLHDILSSPSSSLSSPPPLLLFSLG